MRSEEARLETEDLLCLHVAQVASRLNSNVLCPACRLFPDLPPGGGAVLIQFLRFMILINQLIPISLYVTLELVKVMQCTLLTWDLHMYHRASGTPFLCRTTTLNEELGQVQYVLSDKTGQWLLPGSLDVDVVKRLGAPTGSRRPFKIE